MYKCNVLIRILMSLKSYIVLISILALIGSSYAQEVDPLNQFNSPPSNWNPIIASGKQFLLTDKLVTLSNSGLPSQILSMQKALLADSIKLYINDTPLDSSADIFSMVPVNNGDQVNYSTDLFSENHNFKLDGHIEYDGLISFRLYTNSLPKELIGSKISYKVKLNNEVARFLHRPSQIGTRNIDLDKVKSINSAYYPFIWLGNDDRGVFWFSETTVGWGNAEKNDAIKVYQDSSGWTLEITVNAKPLNNGSWSHRFGFAPTPVKRLPQNWRKLLLMPAKNMSAAVIWPNEKEANFPYFGYPLSNSTAEFTSYVNKLSKSGVTAAPYACPTWIETSTPEWKINSFEWAGGVSDKTYNPRKAELEFLSVCPSIETWQSFVKERFGEFISLYKLKGIYMDNAQVYSFRNCVTKNEDLNAIEYPMLPQRNIYRNIDKQLKQNTKEPISIVHSSGGINAMSFSTALAWVNGEQYRNKVETDYLDIVSLTDFRVELNGPQWGFVPIFLPEFSSKYANELAPTRKLMSILLLHDVRPWPLWANKTEIDRGLKMLDDFGINDADFIPYYSKTSFAGISQQDMYVSGYKKKDRILLIAANLAKKNGTGRMCFPRGLVQSKSMLVTWPNRLKQSLVGNCTNVTINAGSYNMYLLSGVK